MNSEEGYRIAGAMRDSGESALSAAAQIGEHVEAMRRILEPGYGGVGQELLEELRKYNELSPAQHALLTIKKMVEDGEYSDEGVLKLIEGAL